MSQPQIGILIENADGSFMGEIITSGFPIGCKIINTHKLIVDGFGAYSCEKGAVLENCYEVEMNDVDIKSVVLQLQAYEANKNN